MSADGRIVASAGADESGRNGAVMVFDTTTRSEIARITADGPIEQVDVSSDGRYVLSRTFGGVVQLLDVEAGTTERIDASPTPTQAFFRPGQAQFVLVGEDGSLSLWDAATRARLRVPLPGSPLRLASFAPDGTLVVGEPTGALFWDVDRNREVRRVEMQLPAVLPDRFVISPDGKLLAGAADEGQVYIWDLTKGDLLGDPGSRPDGATGLAFSPTSPSVLAIGSSGAGVSLYDVESERLVGDRLFGHGAGTRDVTFSADGRYLVTIADDGLIGLWGEGSGLISTAVDNNAWNPSYSSDGRRVAVGVDGGIEIRNGRRPRAPGVRVQYPPGGWSDLSFQLSADGSALLVFSTEFSVAFVADAATGEPIWASRPNYFSPVFATVSPDGSTVATVDSTYSRLRLTDVRTGENLAEVTVADAAPKLDPGVSGRPAFSSDGRYLDVPTNLGVARFGARDLRPVGFAAADQNVQGVRDVPGSSHVIGSGVGGQVWRWDMTTGELLARGRSRDSSSLVNLAVSPDGSMVAAYHPFSAQLVLFDATTLRPIGKPFRVGSRWFTPRFSPDARFVMGNGLANTMTRWDVSPETWKTAACRAAGRNLTRVEWAEYLDDEPYRPTCPE